MEPAYQKQINLKSVVTDTLTMAKRGLLKVKHKPDKLMDVTFNPVIIMILFTFLFGGAIAGSAGDYLTTIIPGAYLQTLVMASAAAGIQLREDMDTGVFDRFKSLPIARIAPLAGIILADIVRYAIATIFAMGTGFLLGWRPGAGIAWLLVANILAIFATWAISWIFALVGLLVKSTSAITGISMMLTMTFSFLSNAFVPIESLPKALQVFANINPITHLIKAFKEIAYYGNFGSDAWISIIASCLIVALIAPITVQIYSKKV